MKHILLSISLFIFGSLSMAQSHTAEILHNDTKIEFTGKKLIKSHHVSIQINNSEGLNYAYVDIPKRRMVEVGNIKAYITDKNGNIIRKLKNKEIVFKSNISSGSFYANDFQYSFQMIHNEFPYILHYDYQSEQEEFIRIHQWQPNLYFYIPTLESSLSLNIPDDYEIRIHEEQIQHTKSEGEEGRIEYTWSGNEYLPFREESYMPPISEVLPSVTIIPMNFMFEISGTHESWQSFGRFIDSLNSGLNKLPLEEENKIDALVKGVDNDERKIEILFQYLQDETRYVNVSIDVGGLKSHPASYVAENKYGDCKALSNYFKSMLEYVGIKAYLTLIQASKKIYPIEDELPSSQFNHMILYIPLDNDSLWIDCTSDFNYGYIGSSLQGREALIIDGENSFFKKTKELGKEDVQLSRNFYIKRKVGDGAKVIIRSSFKGRNYEILHQIKTDFEKSRKMELLNDYFVEDMVQAPDEIVFITSNSIGEIILDYQTSSNIILQKMGDETMVRIPKTKFPKLEKPKHRDFELQIYYPIYQLDQIVFEKPENGQITFLPKNCEIRTEFGEYIVEVTENEKHIIIDKSFYMKAGHYSLDQYLDIYEFVSLAKKNERKLLITLSD